MSWGKRIVYAWITYFLAAFGIAGFYFNATWGKLIKSRLLCWYTRLFSLIILLTTPLILLKFWYSSPTILTQSKLTVFCLKTYPAVIVAMTVSCVYSAQRGQRRIFRIIEHLLIMKRHGMELDYFKQRLYLLQLFWFRSLLIFPQVLMNLSWAFVGISRPLIFHVNFFLSRNVICALEFLIFTLIFQICEIFLRIQSRLEHLLLNPMPMPIQLQKIMQIQRTCLRLMRMIKEICSIFKYPLFFGILHVISHSCFNGCLFVRVLFGQPVMEIPRITNFMIASINLIEILQFYALVKICDMASELIGSTLYILRYPTFNVDLVERSVSVIDNKIIKCFIILLKLFNTEWLVWTSVNMAKHYNPHLWCQHN